MCHVQLQATESLLHEHSLDAAFWCAVWLAPNMHKKHRQLLPGLRLLAAAAAQLPPKPQLQLALLPRRCQQSYAIILDNNLLPCAACF